MESPDVRLDEFDKTEWFDVARIFKPGLTQEEYEVMWGDYMKAKQEWQKSQLN